MKLCPHVILEGTRLTHKTELAFRLNEHPGFVGPRKYRYHSPVVSGEWCGFTNTPWGRGLINFNPEEESRALETYNTWVRLFELLRYYSWIVDRFHISTQVHQMAARGAHYEFFQLEARLAAIDFRIILCTRDPGSFAAARTARLAVSGNPRQYDDLSRFIVEQGQFREAVRRSTLRSLEIDVTDDDLDLAADRVVAWLGETGGLGSPT
ncbi:hypothetical protein RAS1_06560 [Phycisphaerae bacterium RAS1]|nr:hypothetical protein RAS1_06560 [Phycisphaerae bacterium RAS1]